MRKEIAQNFKTPSFRVLDRLARVVWKNVWLIFAAWTPRFFNPWRVWLLRLFGATIGKKVDIRSSVKIWWPGNLVMEDGTTLGPDVICYNMTLIHIGRGVTVSQRAELCTGSHVIDGSSFSLTTKPIIIEANVWIASNAFVGPGVNVGEGAVLGACSVTFSDLEPWFVYVGNPAKKMKARDNFLKRDVKEI